MQLGLALEAFDSFQVSSLLKAAELPMRTLPPRRLPILPQLLTQLCQLTSSLGSLGPSTRVCLTFGFLGMLRQSNLAPPSASAFNPTRNSCRGDVILAPPRYLTCCSVDKNNSSHEQDTRPPHTHHLRPPSQPDGG